MTVTQVYSRNLVKIRSEDISANFLVDFLNELFINLTYLKLRKNS